MKPKHLTKEQILNAMSKTRSARACARYLGCSYQHFRKFAKIYIDEETGKNLLELQKNPSGKGIPKFISDNHKGGIDRFPILDIIEGRVNSDSFKPEKIKDAMIRGGLLKEECAKCGYHERRLLDFKMPLLMWFPDGNKKNYKDVKLVCYNCYFVHIGDVFNRKQLNYIEDHSSQTNKQVEWELDEYQLERLKELENLGNQPVTSSNQNDDYDLVSRKW